MRNVLGSKGAGLAAMSKAGVPALPASLSPPKCAISTSRITTRAPQEVDKQIHDALQKLENQMGKKLGQGDDPLLVGVRSSAKSSMPGMMNTILNLGLNDESAEALARKTGNPRFAYDRYRQSQSQIRVELERSSIHHQRI
ncbi:MAG: PEP/pyruvate-binding domain-containing protein [Bryobacteraceae bacterium]